MEWWQCSARAGAFGALIGFIRIQQKDALFLAQEAKHAGLMGVAGRTITALAFQFVVVGLILCTGVWFGYWLFFA